MDTNAPSLPKEVVALVQHIELNRSEWWVKTVQRLVLSAIWLAGEPLRNNAIQKLLKDQFGLDLKAPQLESALAKLENQQEVLRMPEGTFNIPQEKRKAIEAEIAAAEHAQNAARNFYCSLVTEHGLAIDGMKSWTTFESKFLIPYVNEIGANAYNLIAGKAIASDLHLVKEFLRGYEPALHSKLRELVTAFLDPKKAEVRDHISRLLHARFCVDASGLPEAVLEKIKASLGKQLTYNVFVDTNFLFSLLGLHENPSNAAALELKELVDQLKTNPKVSFYITPETIEEAKKVIEAAKSKMTGIPATELYTRVAIHAGLSGMAKRFMNERLRRGANLTPEGWFDPFLKDFVPMAKAKGVELHNKDMDSYSMRQDVIDDINDFMQREEMRRPPYRRKSYESVRHDMVLWHFVHDRRPAYAESPLDVADWILTVDFRLINFDKRKLNGRAGRMPVCLHPSSMVQLLQFWVPRSQEFEEAMLGSMRLPFLFQEFDAEGEQLTIRILKGLGRFGIDDEVSEETVTRIVFNEGLRNQLNAPEVDEDDDIDLIRDALVEEMKVQLASEKAKAKEAEEKANSKASEAERHGQTVAQVVREKSDLEKRIERIEEEHREALLQAKEEADKHKQAAEEYKKAAEEERVAKEQARKSAEEKERLAQGKDGQAQRTAKIASVITGIMAVALFELVLNYVKPCRWLIEHPNAYGLQVGISLMLLTSIVGVWVKSWRNWCWGVALVGLLFAVVPLLGGPQQLPSKP